jgi:phenylpropionate dioxygenase-like ring-hydroxylating dioxygenase large terminal subunit
MSNSNIFEPAAAERYFSTETARLEEQKLWPKVWLVACRLEQVERPGDYAVFDIGRETILVVRAHSGALKAFYNVCQHRGRRLREGCGNTGKTIFCAFHGWRWSTDGELVKAVDEEDWSACPSFFEDKNLPELKVDHWAGWVFVSMDPNAEPLLDYLAPLPELIDPYELEDTKIAWGASVKLPCNWKVVVNAFAEAYHSETTHAQLNKYGRSKAVTRPLGKHSHFRVVASGADAGQNLGNARKFKDMAEMIEYREKERTQWLGALTSEYSLDAALSLREAIPDDASPDEIVCMFRELHRANMEAAGAKWPEGVTAEVMAKAGVDLHVFPNLVFLPNFDGALVHRIRPDAEDPEKCWHDVWWLRRFGTETPPPYQHIVYQSMDEAKGFNAFIEQDFGNMAGIQQGIHSHGFKGSLYNPLQESSLVNFEFYLDAYLSAPS